MSYGVIYGTKSWSIGSPVAYTERCSLTVTPQFRIRVPDGDGVYRWRKNAGFVYGLDASFVMLDDSQYDLLRTHMLDDEYLTIAVWNDTDTNPTTWHWYISNQTKDALAGDSGPTPERFHLVAEAYPDLDPAGEPGA